MDKPLDELRGTKSTRTAKLKLKWTKHFPSVRAQPEMSSVSHNAEIDINESLTLYRNGKIMLRKSDTSTPQCFVSFEDFDDHLDRISQNS